MITIYSDGGSSAGNSAAAACLIELNGGIENAVKLAAYLGPATNNEAEIAAGLIALSYLQLLEAKGILPAKELTWVCDSEYVLKSATQYIHNWLRNGWKTANRKPVKNQGLWRAYLQLANGLKIIPEHVRGHTGHPENEACDSALTWMREKGKHFLEEGHEGEARRTSSFPAGNDWVMLDGRTFLEGLREEEPGEDDVQAMMEKLKGLIRI